VVNFSFLPWRISGVTGTYFGTHVAICHQGNTYCTCAELAMFILLPCAQDEDLVYHKATSNRHRLVTVPSGTVSAELNVIARHFSEYGVDST